MQVVDRQRRGSRPAKAQPCHLLTRRCRPFEQERHDGGHTFSQVQWVAAACAQKRAAEKRGAMATLPPLASGVSMVTTKALM